MVFKSENHELVVQKQFMELNQRNLENRTPMLYPMDPRCLPFELMKNILSGQKTKYLQVGHGFQT